MKAFTKILALFSLVLPCVSWADGSNTFYTLSDLAGTYVTYYQSADANSVGPIGYSQAIITQSTTNSDGTGVINWASSTIILPPHSNDFITNSNTDGNQPNPQVTIRSVITDPVRGAGYLILFDFPFAKAYTVLDFIAFSDNPNYKVTGLVLNGNSGTPTKGNFSSLIPTGYSQGPNTNIGISHAVRQILPSQNNQNQQ